MKKTSRILATALAVAVTLPTTVGLVAKSTPMSNSITATAEETTISTINGIEESKYRKLVNEAICLTNEYRKSKGLSTLKTSSILGDMAAQRAQEQEITGLSHTRPDGTSCFTIYDNYNVDWTALAENCASGQTSAESVVSAWKNSEYHNLNMLGDFEYISIGVAYYQGCYYWVQMFCSTDDIKVTGNAYLTERVQSNASGSTTVETDENKMLQKGDINEDGKIDIIDLILLRKYLLEMSGL
jgi:uncharacterized protein YkwD